MSEFVPFKQGDIVEHTSYLGVLFEIVTCHKPVFENRRLFSLMVFGKLDNRPLQNNLKWSGGITYANRTHLRHPQNEMEVLAVAWAGRTSD